jgi:hypothetical protein
MCFYVGLLCLLLHEWHLCVHRRVAMLSIMSLLPSYTHKKKKNKKKTLRVLLLVVRHRSRIKWGCHMWYQSGFNSQLGIAMAFIDMI